MVVGRGEASKRVMGPTPDLPILRERVNSCFSLPMGEITPIPVMRARFFTEACFRVGLWGNNVSFSVEKAPADVYVALFDKVFQVIRYRIVAVHYPLGLGYHLAVNLCPALN